MPSDPEPPKAGDAPPPARASSGALLQAVLDSAMDGILAAEPSGRVVEANRAAQKLFGRSRDALLASRLDDLLQVPDAEDSTVELYLSTGGHDVRGERISMRVRAADGTDVPVEVTVTPAEVDRRPLIVLHVRDVRAQLAADQHLRESEERFRLVADQAPVMIWMSDAAGRTEFLNRPWCEFTGRSLGDVLEAGWDGDIHADDRERVIATRTDSLAAKRGFATEFRLWRADGQYRWVADTAVPRLGRDGSFAGLIGTLVDVTDHRDWEQTLAEKNRELARKNADLQQFAYAASHDLQEPLRMVAGFTDLLSQRYGQVLDERGRQYMEYAADGARRMQRLIQDLLAYSRLETHGAAFEAVDAAQCLDAALARLRPAIEREAAEVSAGELPAVRGDAQQLGRVFEQLVDNAIKFRGSDAPRVRIEAVRRGADVEFSVRDNGIGFDPAFAERVFVIFQRLHPRGAYPGTGLGLAVCRRIVERHGGRIWVETEPGKGADFRFTLAAA